MADLFSVFSRSTRRTRKSFAAIPFGFLFLAISAGALFWNENRSARTAESLGEGTAAVVSAGADQVIPSNEGKLIHVTGEANSPEAVTDPVFGVSVNGLRLQRNVEMYQWREEQKTETRNHATTDSTKIFNYERVWSGELIDSSKFEHSKEYPNPGSILAGNQTIYASQIALGAFRLPRSVVEKMDGEEALNLTEADLAKLEPTLKVKAKLNGNGFYFGADPSVPAIGDQRVEFKVLRPAIFSVLAQQSGGSLAPFATRAGHEIERVERGEVTAVEMFQHAGAENTTTTWGLRVMGFFLMCLGMRLVLGPIRAAADFIPFLGGVLGAGVTLAALILGLLGSLVTISLAWVVVRPILGAGVLGLVLLWILINHRMGARRPTTAVSSEPQP